MKKILTSTLLLLIGACASNSGVIPTGNGNFIISKQAATGFPGTGQIKIDALQEASSYCRSQTKELDLIKLDENEGPFIFGKYPRVELYFRCK